MTDRVFQDARCFEVYGNGSSAEVYIFGPGDKGDQDKGNVMISVIEEDEVWDSQRASFTMTAEEATMLKEFLISKGY